MCIGRAKLQQTPIPRPQPPRRPGHGLLRDLVAMYDLRAAEPIPLPLKTSYAYAEARFGGGDARYAAGAAGGQQLPGDDAHPPA